MLEFSLSLSLMFGNDAKWPIFYGSTHGFPVEFLKIVQNIRKTSGIEMTAELIDRFLAFFLFLFAFSNSRNLSKHQKRRGGGLGGGVLVGRGATLGKHKSHCSGY